MKCIVRYLKIVVSVAVRWVIGLFAAVLLLLPGTVAAQSDPWPGWSYTSGTWYKAGTPYVANTYSEPYTAYQYYTAYDYCGRAYQAQRAYTAYRTKTYYTPVKIDPATDYDGAISSLLGIVRDQAATDNINRLRAGNVANFGRMADILGVRENFRVQNYGLNPMLPGYLSQMASAGTYGYSPMQVQTGNSIYSQTTYKQAVDAYGTSDINAWVLRGAQLTEGSQVATSQAMAGIQGIIQTGVAGQSESDRLRARRDLAVATIQATGGPPQVKVTTEATTLTPVQPQPVQPAPPTYAPQQQPEAAQGQRGRVVSPEEQVAWMALGGPAKCVQCHGQGTKNQKQFDLTAYHPRSASRELKRRVGLYVSDPKGCPKEGQAKVTTEELVQLLVDSPADSMPAAKE